MNTGMILMQVYVFVLAIFAGYQLISKVPPTLHTPLMSGTNAIAGISILGSLVLAQVSARAPFGLSTIIATLAVTMAMINVVGGFLITDRMMRMFKSNKS